MSGGSTLRTGTGLSDRVNKTSSRWAGFVRDRRPTRSSLKIKTSSVDTTYIVHMDVNVVDVDDTFEDISNDDENVSVVETVGGRLRPYNKGKHGKSYMKSNSNVLNEVRRH